MSNENANANADDNVEHELEPYKLSEVFSIIPEYDGNQIFLQTFLNSCRCAFDMAIGNQVLLLTLHIKNKLRGKAAEIVNSRNPNTWHEIRNLLETHFGDSRDLTSLIQDLQRISQSANETPLNFVSRLQTHNAKMHAAIQKRNLTTEQKEAQSDLIETMTLNTLLTGLDPKLGSIIRASNPRDMLQATSRIKREIQLSYFETQKYQKHPNSNPTQIRKPLNNMPKQCSFCKRTGHNYNECRMRQQPQTSTGFQNFSRPNFQMNPNQPQTSNANPNFQRPQFNQNQFQRPPFNQNQFQRPPFNQNQFQQNRPSAIRPNPNFNQQRPSIIRPNPNYNNQSRTHHVNYQDNQYSDESYQSEYHDDNSQEYFNNYEYPTDQQWSYEQQQDTTDFEYQNNSYDYGYNNQEINDPASLNFTTENDTRDLPQNFQSLQIQNDPPDQQTNALTPIQTCNLSNPKPNSPEQRFI